MSTSLTRRGFIRTGAAAAVLSTPPFYGPWRHNTALAQNKPIRVGLTCDASGQYAASGQDDLRGIRLALEEINARGGVLGRRIEWITADTETQPETGSRVAERFVTQEDCAYLIGAVHSGVAHAITKVADQQGVIYLNTNSSAPSEARENVQPHQVRLGRQRHQLRQGRGQERDPVVRHPRACC